MQTAFNYISIALAVFLVILFLLQVKGTGGGLFGGGSGGAYRTRRGFEQTLFRATILLVLIFLAVSIVSARLV